MEYGCLVAIVELELYEGPGELKRWKIGYCGIFKELVGGGIDNGEDGGKSSI